MKYDLAIAHRVCPALSKTAVGFSDKFEMVKVATRSLAAALEGIRVKLVVILDGCPAEYKQLYDSVFDVALPSMDVQYECVTTDSIGNAATYAKQHEVLKACSDEASILYFSEDDYIYRKDAFRAMMDFLKEPDVDFVTPLDHPDRYSHVVPERRQVEVRVSEYCHWREVGTTCCTFMTKRETFLAAGSRLSAYGRGVGDGGMWIELTKDSIFSPSATIGAAIRYVMGRRKTVEGFEFMVLAAWRWHKWRLPFGRRYHLWGPMPTLAVHLCKSSIPPFANQLSQGAFSGYSDFQRITYFHDE